MSPSNPIGTGAVIDNSPHIAIAYADENQGQNKVGVIQLPPPSQEPLFTLQQLAEDDEFEEYWQEMYQNSQPLPLSENPLQLGSEVANINDRKIILAPSSSNCAGEDLLQKSPEVIDECKGGSDNTQNIGNQHLEELQNLQEVLVVGDIDVSFSFKEDVGIMTPSQMENV